MAYTKEETVNELREFMHGFAYSIARLYSNDVVAPMLGLPNADAYAASFKDCNFDETSLWRAVTKMYDYGVMGINNGGIGLPQGSVEDCYADTEMFFVGLPGMDLYLGEDNVFIPRRAIRAAQTAVARHVLEGGERWTFVDTSENEDMGVGMTNQLSIKEVAYLADLDERSVRNACNPKLAGHLETVAVGKRTMVEPEAAKRWLSTRKGYVPLRRTSQAESSPPVLPALATLELPEQLLVQLNAKAAEASLSLNEYLAKLAQA